MLMKDFKTSISSVIEALLIPLHIGDGSCKALPKLVFPDPDSNRM